MITYGQIPLLWHRIKHTTLLKQIMKVGMNDLFYIKKDYAANRQLATFTSKHFLESAVTDAELERMIVTLWQCVFDKGHWSAVS